ncbi:hypothetical protein H310_09887 [Aphanomyces invadans]|uniref:Dynactin subunit 4 n=1 Tax=Aphanomyces invadans TaxID=157072 RepID=A0A024TSR5_9STRA|nr:hypothetical protein H310_09887 [Aphanomyces invadans]ETV97063.1 hypothetical protein H310_09887 [Aphanomyces invadans]|eukprot:XP_008874309.1 hypothetical protein H310_09887 [Aphanomyces invadans]
MSIEYSCGCGRQYPLAELYWSDTCKKIVCPWPTCSLQEIDSYFCRFQMDNLPSKEAATYKNRSARTFACPDCKSTLQTIKHDKYMFFCAHCRWDSDSIQLTDEDPDTLMMVANTREREEHVFDVLLSHYQQKAAQTSGPHHTGTRSTSKRSVTTVSSSRFLKQSLANRKQSVLQRNWKMEDLEMKLKETLSTAASAVDATLVEKCRLKVPQHERFHSVDAVKAAQTHDMAVVSTLAQRNLCTPLLQSRDVSALFPSRPDLRVKRSWRCVESMASGAPGILVKPQINPMTGDSSMVVAASWWKKASLAIHVVPSITIRRLWELNASSPNDAVAWLLVENPLEEDVVLVVKSIDGNARVPTAPIRVGGYEDPNLIDITGADIIKFIDMADADTSAVLVSRNYAKIKLETSIDFVASRSPLELDIHVHDASAVDGSSAESDVSAMPLLCRFVVALDIPVADSPRG